MEKLLQGRQLYISKHMHAQELHADKDDLADPRPITKLHPCVSTHSIGGVLLDIPMLTLYQREPAPIDISVHKIGTGSFMFLNTPDKLGDAQLYPWGAGNLDVITTHINSFLHLATIHWADLFEILLCSLYSTFLHTFITERDFHPEAEGCSYAGDSYTGAFNSTAGAFGCSVHLTFHLDYSRDYAWLFYYCPINTIMEIRRKIAEIPTVLSVRHNSDDTYTVY